MINIDNTRAVTLTTEITSAFDIQRIFYPFFPVSIISLANNMGIDIFSGKLEKSLSKKNSINTFAVYTACMENKKPKKYIIFNSKVFNTYDNESQQYLGNFIISYIVASIFYNGDKNYMDPSNDDSTSIIIGEDLIFAILDEDINLLNDPIFKLACEILIPYNYGYAINDMFEDHMDAKKVAETLQVPEFVLKSAINDWVNDKEEN